MQQERIFIGTGSNVGDRAALLDFAQNRIHQSVGRVVNASKIYINPAWGFRGPDFFNQVLEIRSECHPLELLQRLKELEDAAGRLRSFRGYANRTLDADLLYYGNRRMHVPELSIPHPLNAQRRFVLAPLAQIAPEFRDPQSGKSVLDLLNACPDSATGNWL